MPPAKTPRALTEANFGSIFSEVRTDINILQLHDTVFSGVIDSLAKFPSLGVSFPAFFNSFFAAMRTDLVIRLGRIYDPEGTGHPSCTLSRCLSALRENPHFFTDSAITGRLNEDYRKANPTYLLSHQHIDSRQINVDLAEIARSRKRLINLRHKVYAHKDLQTVLSGQRQDLLSTHAEVKDLISLAHQIWNRYSQVWNASTHSTKTIGEDDYKWLVEAIRRGMKAKSRIENRQLPRLRARLAAYGRTINPQASTR